MPLRSKRDQEAMDKQHEVAMAELARPEQGMPMTEDYVNSLGRSVYSIIDPEVLGLLTKNKMEFLMPLISHLNRMTNINKLDVELDRLDIEYNFLRLKCTMNTLM